MITLITGAPGAGKTAALVDMLSALGRDRPLFVHGIPELKLPHVTLDQPETWPDTVPDGAVVVIDEVQTVWRPAGPGQRVPDHIAKLETHRHRGLDFYIITQGPNLVHSNVRALVGRHVHLRDVGFLGRWWYEWPETADNCRTGWKTAPLKKRYKLAKKVFGTYKSASLHVKPVRSFPVVLVVLVAALGGVAFLAWKSYATIESKMAGGVPAALTGQLPAALPGQLTTAPTQSPQVPAIGGPPDERVAFIPRLSDRPWTAPAYDQMRVVVRVPSIAGGICKGGECVCFTEHGERLDVGSKACAQWMAARPFDPYSVPVKPSAASPVDRAEKGADRTEPAERRSDQQHGETVEVPMPSGVSNPRGELMPRVPILPKSERAQALAGLEKMS